MPGPFVKFLAWFLTEEQKKKVGAYAGCIILVIIGAYGAISTKEWIIETAQAAQPAPVKYDDTYLLAKIEALARNQHDQEVKIKEISDRQLKHGSKIDKVLGQMDIIIYRIDRI